MGFIMDGLDAEAYDRQYNDRDLVKRIIGYFRPEVGRMLIVALAIALTTLANTIVPIYISKALDWIQVDQAAGRIVQITVVLLLLACSGWVFNAIHRWFASQAVANVVLKLREDAFDAVLERDLSFYDQFPSGKIVSRVTSDTQSFSQVVTLTMDLLSRVLIVFVLIGYLFTV